MNPSSGVRLVAMTAEQVERATRQLRQETSWEEVADLLRSLAAAYDDGIEEERVRAVTDRSADPELLHAALLAAFEDQEPGR